MPNGSKAPREYEPELVKNQVRYLGLVENMKVRRAGYPYRMKYGWFMWRYKMIVPDLWPTYSMSDKEAAQKLVNVFHLEPLVKFGKTKIFLRTPRTVYYLESLREEKMVYISMTISRWMMGHHARVLRRKMIALINIFIWYRRYHARKWFSDVVEKCKDCNSLPDWGKSLEWPAAPTAVKVGSSILKKVHINWWARKKCTALTNAEQYEVRLKTIAFTLLGGRKTEWHFSKRWIGDELVLASHNSKASQFVKQTTAYMDLNHDTARLYSGHVIKLNRSMKPDPRVYVLCDLHLYRLDSSYKMKNKPPIELGQILSLSISPGEDQALVIHCAEEVGDCVFYMDNGRPAAELMAAIWYTFWRKYKQRLPVYVSAEIKFKNDGIPKGILQCDPGHSQAKASGFKKMGGQRVSILWAD